MVGDGASGPAVPTLAVDAPGLSREELSLLVFNRIEATLVRERDRLVGRINHGDCEVTRFRDFADDLAHNVARDLGAYAGRVGLPLEVHEADVARGLAPFASRLNRALDRLSAAVARAEEADVPTSELDAWVQGVQLGLSDSAGYGALGAAIGTVVPGVGTVIGGAVGGWYGGRKRQKEIDGVLAAYERAFGEVAELVDAAEEPIYAAVAEGASFLVAPAEINALLRTAVDRCKRVDECIERGDVAAAFEEFGDDEPLAYRGLLVRMFNLIGNHLSQAEDARASFRTGYLGEAGDEWWEEMDAVAEHSFYDAVLLEAVADHWAYLGEGARALAAVAAARAAGASGSGIEVSEANARGVLGDHLRALAALDRAEAEGVTAFTARLRARSLAALGEREAAAAAVAATLGITLTLDGARNVLEEDGLGDLLEEPALRPLYAKGRIVAMAKAWFPHAPGLLVAPRTSDEKLKNARESYLDEAGGGEVLVLIDGTVWGSAKNGVAVLEDRIAWRELWGPARWLHVPPEGHGAYAEADGERTLTFHVGEEAIGLPCPAEHQQALARLINALA